MSDQALGVSVLVLSVLGFLYYTVWEEQSLCARSRVVVVVVVVAAAVSSRGIVSVIDSWLSWLSGVHALQVLVTPFAEEDAFIQTLFPPRLYAILVPAYAGVLLCALVAGFIGMVMLRSSNKSVKQT
eukprot:1182369-Prorocentrum_minimum.AAC.2